MQSNETSRDAIQLEQVPAYRANGFVVALGLDGLPVFKAEGPADYVCGRCRAVICEGVPPGLFGSIMFRCSCGAVSRWKDAHGGM